MLDNYDLYDIHEREREKEASCFPQCKECKERIFTEKCYEFDDDVICEDCVMDYINENYRKSVMDLIEEED